MPCPVSGCNAAYSRTNSVRSHVYRRHRSSIICSSDSAIVNASSGTVVKELVVTPVPHMDLSLPGTISHDVDILLHRDEREQKNCF